MKPPGSHSSLMRRKMIVKTECVEFTWGSTLFEWALNDIYVSKVERERRERKRFPIENQFTFSSEHFFEYICKYLWNHLWIHFKHLRFHFNYLNLRVIHCWFRLVMVFVSSEFSTSSSKHNYVYAENRHPSDSLRSLKATTSFDTIAGLLAGPLSWYCSHNSRRGRSILEIHYECLSWMLWVRLAAIYRPLFGVVLTNWPTEQLTNCCPSSAAAERDGSIHI